MALPPRLSRRPGGVACCRRGRVAAAGACRELPRGSVMWLSLPRTSVSQLEERTRREREAQEGGRLPRLRRRQVIAPHLRHRRRRGDPVQPKGGQQAGRHRPGARRGRPGRQGHRRPEAQHRRARRRTRRSRGQPGRLPARDRDEEGPRHVPPSRPRPTRQTPR